MHGGKRSGAGRPNGAKDKRKAKVREVVEELAQHVEAETPVTLWTRILQSKEFPLELRLAVARDLAPYVHPKLSSTEAKVKMSMTHEEELDALERVAKANGLSNGKAN